MNEILHQIWQDLTNATALDQVNLVLGVVGVGLMVRRKLAAFPLCMLGAVVQGVLFVRSRIYADALLQGFFFVALGAGWWHWVKHRGAAHELPVTTQSWRGRGLTLAVIVAATVGWALALRHWTNAVMPWRDALIAVLQAVGQVLQSRKKLECWALFTGANLIAIPAYWSVELAYTACLFGVYLVLGLAGWRSWWKAMRA